MTAEDLNLIKDLLKDILEEDNIVNDLVVRIKEKLLNSEGLLQVRKYIWVKPGFSVPHLVILIYLHAVWISLILVFIV